jgi:endoglucanase
MEGDWGPVLHAADFPRIARRGFDHVRLPTRFSSHALTVAPYTVDASFFARVDWAIEQALGSGLAIIIDLANYEELVVTPNLHRDRFLALWGQIADHYRAFGPQVAFELLSEPSGALDASWNALAASALQIVRGSNPTRVVIIASTNVASPTTLPALTIPDDPNVMASIHAYEPSLFSFQGRAWMGPVWATVGIVFPGPPPTPLVPVPAAAGVPWASQWFADYNRLPAAQNPSGPKAIQTEMQLIQDFKSRTGHAVYNGQWGPQAGGDAISRVNYLRMVRGECDKAGVGWAIWDDQSNLTLFDPTTGAWVESLVAPLFP